MMAHMFTTTTPNQQEVVVPVPKVPTSTCIALSHTWEGLCMHIPRRCNDNLAITRCVLGKLVVATNGVVGIRAFFMANGSRKSKVVSPVTIVALHIMWVNVDVVSESDDEDAPMTSLSLPKLVVDTDTFQTLDESAKNMRQLLRHPVQHAAPNNCPRPT